MTKFITLNSENVVEGSSNSKYTYKFSPSQKFTDEQICLTGIDIYYSWFNISTALNNNTFTYKWFSTTGNLTITNSVVIPDGYYTVESINLYVLAVLKSRFHYLVDSSQKEVYYIAFRSNASKYRMEIVLTPIPAILPTSWTKPGGANWALPATQSTIIIIILGTNTFGKLLGFNAGTYPSTGGTNSLTILTGNLTPQISPISSLVMRCNMVKNEIGLPNDILYTFTQGSSAWGDIISFAPNNPRWCDIPNGSFYECTIDFVDQQYRPVIINDPQLLINIEIRDKPKALKLETNQK